MGKKIWIGLDSAGDDVEHTLRRMVVFDSNYDRIFYGGDLVGEFTYHDESDKGGLYHRIITFQPYGVWKQRIPYKPQRRMIRWPIFPYQQIREEVQYWIAVWECKKETGKHLFV